MSDETTPEAIVASGPAATPTTTPTGSSTTSTSGTTPTRPPAARASQSDGPAPSDRAEASDPTGAPKRRRRRGSRGGRNRRKPGTGAGGANGANGANGAAAGASSDAGRGDDGVDDELGDEPHVGHDYTDEAADRGMTTDDVAETAREEAGLTGAARAPESDQRRPAPAAPAGPAAPAEPASSKPQIGDSRPAPAATNGGGAAAASGEGTGAPKRRRRRGGRGRGRGGAGGAGGGAGTTPAATGGRPPRATAAGDVVRADLGVGESPVAELDDDILERRRGRTRKGRPAGRYLMCVHVLEGGHTHIAVLEGRSLVEHSLATPTGNESIDGNIYFGRVQNVLPGMEAAFIDIGTPKNGVLYRGDVAFDKADLEGGNKPKIERALKNGQMITVQVTKNPIAHKGARLTQEVSLAGRFLVMVPNEPDTYGISKRLPDDERKRLRKVLDGIRPEDAGLIVRTAAEGATREELERDVRRLRSQWEQISALASTSKSAKLLYQEPDLVLRRIREEFTKEYRGIVIDDRALYEEIRGYVEAITPELADRIEYYDADEEGLPIFERFHISEQLLKALDRKVWLPSGGSLIIERTEALTVIDVNTGKNVGKSNLEETVFRNNLEAAEEVARQLRLRDIGGIIVIDFVDMEIKANRDEVMKVFRDALARDKTRTQAFEMSELGLVEMTRKRISEGLVESFSETCQTCHGRGFVLDEALLRSVD
ncbi:MAG TPA: Rne/Rng family ribonuclease [Acidimicrobiia bacterium]|nr:Rne/Rng family ribonuclease [Acidimicrobiia bacterium]